MVGPINYPSQIVRLTYIDNLNSTDLISKYSLKYIHKGDNFSHSNSANFLQTRCCRGHQLTYHKMVMGKVGSFG